MDVLEKKQIPQDMLKYVEALRYDNDRIYFEGSASLIRTKYAGDVDLLTYIKGDNQMYVKFKDILDKSDAIDNMYFTEGKVQLFDGKKLRFYKTAELKPEMLKNPKKIDFVKLDYVILLSGLFVELSIIYTVRNGQKVTAEDIIKSVKIDYNHYVEDGQIFKALKRLFIIIKLLDIDKSHKTLDGLLQFFNSDAGRLYKQASALKAIVLFREHFKDAQSERIAESVYKNLGFKDSISKIQSHIHQNEKIFNKAAMDYYEETFED